MARPLEGGEYYRALLRSAPWLREEAPRLYRRWEAGGLPAGFPEDGHAGLGIRIFDALVFPWVAAYLQAVGLLRNARHRRTGDAESTFRTVTRRGRMTFRVGRFDRLKRIYALASGVRPGSEPISRGPDEGAPGPTGRAKARSSPPAEAPEGFGPLSD